MQEWLTVSEASPILKMSKQAIYTAVRLNQIPEAAIHRIGRRIRIDPAALSRIAPEDRKVDSATNRAGDSEERDAAR